LQADTIQPANFLSAPVAVVAGAFLLYINALLKNFFKKLQKKA